MILFIPQVQRFDTRRSIMKLHHLLSLCFHYRVSDQVFDKAVMRPLLLTLHEMVVFEYLRAKHDARNCYRLISQVSSQVRLWPWIYHKKINCRYWNEIMCATVVTFKTKHTVGGRKISFGRPDMHMPVTEVNLHNVTSYQKQRLFSFNCKCLQKLIMWLI